MIPFGNLFRAEWRKTLSTRAARWLLAGTCALAVAAEAVPVIFTHDVTQNRASFLTWSALGMSRLLPIVLMLAMTSEWSQRTALITFTLEPRRGRVLAAKIAAGGVLAVACAVFAFAVATVAVLGAHAAGHHVAAAWDWPELAGFALFMMATSAIGVAFGAALHNSAAAIVTYFALGALISLLTIPALAKAGNWVNTTQVFGWMLTGQWSGHGAEMAACVALWILLPLAAGTIRTIRRDIS
jgi:ABC-type transport system involved in multi-copper enzyme maturation permease subunit